MTEHKFDVELCKRVQRYPEIYDVCHERYHSVEAKEQAWKTIAEELRVQPSKCEIKWKTIKHRFVKARKEGNSDWELWPSLKFLDEAADRSSPGKSSRKRERKEGAAKTAVSDGTPPPPHDALVFFTKRPLESVKVGVTVKHLNISATGDILQAQPARSSGVEGPSPKRLRFDRRNGDDIKDLEGMKCDTLDLTFFKQVQEKFTRLPPERVKAMKAAILKALDNEAVS